MLILCLLLKLVVEVQLGVSGLVMLVPRRLVVHVRGLLGHLQSDLLGDVAERLGVVATDAPAALQQVALTNDSDSQTDKECSALECQHTRMSQ